MGYAEHQTTLLMFVIMTQKLSRRFHVTALVALASALLMLAPVAQANEAPTKAAEAVATPATDAAKKIEAATPAADAKTEAPAEKPLTDAEKKTAIQAADDITAFDSSKLVGIAHPDQIYYQPAESPTMKALVPLHDAVLVIITLITLFVLALMIYICLRFNKRKNPKPATFTHNKTVEVIWTVIPILILVGIAIPSLRLHYNYYNNETIIQNPDLTVKIVGHQWYWSYEYPEQKIAFDSNITAEKDLPKGAPRLLEVDNPLVVPVGKVVRLQITSADVMHAWAMPAFGVKKGAIPGRLNETWFKAEKEGIYYGQCSILCGKLHGFMPIKIIVVSPEQFDIWAKGAKLKFASNDSMQFAALN